MTQLYVSKLRDMCGFCSESVPVTAGSILYDGKWYHEKCWNDLTKNNGDYYGNCNCNR